MRKALLLAAVCGLCGAAMPVGLLADTGTTGSDKVQTARTPRRDPAQLRPEIAARLNLTAQQRQQLLDHKTTYRKRVYDLRCQLRLKKADRAKEMQNPNPDKNKLQQLSQEIGQIHGQILVEDANERGDFEKILNPQQLEVWKKIRLEQRDKNPGSSLDDGK
jgi:Spy/CpxP family protein refolding chaperone